MQDESILQQGVLKNMRGVSHPGGTGRPSQHVGAGRRYVLRHGAPDILLGSQ
jgi:hypothetical protein